MDLLDRKIPSSQHAMPFATSATDWKLLSRVDFNTQSIYMLLPISLVDIIL